MEVENEWSLDQVLAAHDVLDLYEKAEQQAVAEAREASKA
jgi:hypothetical protein